MSRQAVCAISYFSLIHPVLLNVLSVFSFQYSNKQKAAPPNFISEIFYLTLAMNHYGYQKTISIYEDLMKQYDDMQRHLEMLEGDGSWRGVSCHDMPIPSSIL